MLKDYNVPVYEATKAMLLEHRECCLVGATGIGKSHITTEIIQDFNLRALVIAPRVIIKNDWSDKPEKHGFTADISTTTYHYFNKHWEEFDGFDIYIFDEAQHTGAKVWGKVIKKFRKRLTTELVLGLTADPKRYSEKEKLKRNVVDFMFNGHAVYGLNQKEAISKGVLPNAAYVCALFNTKELITSYENKLEVYKKESKDEATTDYLEGRLAYTKKNCEAIEDIIRRHAPKNVPVKGIVFVDCINNIDMGVLLARRSFPKEATYYIHSKLSQKENAETMDMFKKAKSGFMVTVDMLNEGLHIDGINIIIMLRKTSSPTIYIQQIGRGLTANGQNVTIYDLVRNDTSIKKVLARIDDVELEVGDAEEECESNDESEDRIRKVSSQFIIRDYATEALEVFEDIDKHYNHKNTNKWTKDEDKILKENYPTMGSKVCELLPGRTESACVKRAGTLGIHVEVTAWTEKEDTIIKENYPTMGSDVYKLLPGRSASICKKRAAKLKVKRRKESWTEDEDEILKENYPTMGSNVYKLLPGRSKMACFSRAELLGMRSDRFVSKWTEDEDEILKENYPNMGSDVYKLLPGRSKVACLRRATHLNCRLNINLWTEEEDELLKSIYPIIGRDAYKLLPGRTMAACGTRAKKLGY